MKSRILSTKTISTPQTSSPAVPVTALLSVENKQQSQQFPKSDNIICGKMKLGFICSSREFSAFIHNKMNYYYTINKIAANEKINVIY